MTQSLSNSQAPSSTSSTLNPPPSSRIICRVCQKQFAQYTCPRCNTRYCSLHCYKSHSLRCTESFMRENVVEELQQLKSNDKTIQKMMDILRRFHLEEVLDCTDEPVEGTYEDDMLLSFYSFLLFCDYTFYMIFVSSNDSLYLRGLTNPVMAL